MLPIPTELRDTLSTLTVEIIAAGLTNIVDTTLHVDDFRFGMAEPELVLLTAGGLLDFGVRQRGESVSLSDVLRLANVTNDTQAILDVWSLEFQGAESDLFASSEFF